MEEEDYGPGEGFLWLPERHPCDQILLEGWAARDMASD